MEDAVRGCLSSMVAVLWIRAWRDCESSGHTFGGFELRALPADRGFRGRILFTTPKTSDVPKPPTLAFKQEDVAIGYAPGTDRLIKTRRIVWEHEPLDLTADEARLANMPTPGGDGRKARAAPVRDFCARF